MGINQPTTGTVCATPSSAAVGTEASVKVTFPTGYTLGLPTAFTCGILPLTALLRGHQAHFLGQASLPLQVSPHKR